MTQGPGTVTISPHALTAIITRTALDVPGVARIASVPPRRVGERIMRGKSPEGVLVRVDDSVSADLYLVAHHDVNLLDLGTEVQAAVANVIREMVGMTVHEVNIHIQDVEAERIG